MPESHQPDHGAMPQLPFLTLWYRFIFFDWMFRDLNSARNGLERHAALQHNRHMCQYLPIYLRRWSCFTLAGFALGCLFERATAVLWSAWFFTGSCVSLTGMVVISVAWALLARPASR